MATLIRSLAKLSLGVAPWLMGTACLAGTDAAPVPQALQIVKAIQAPKAHAGSGQRSSYLLVYFKDDTHSVHFATSRDGYSFTDVNDGKPVLSGRGIAEQHGIRDPYITRGPDGAFYMAMTDLHIAAQREGLRATEWERPAQEYGWGNNRSLIFMKSFDLIHWTHAIVHVDELPGADKDLGTAWAPELIYDPAKKAMMVYFTTRHKNETLHMVYAYTNKAFTAITTPPRDLFTFPKPGVASLDGDITKVGDTYHFFYGINEAPGQIRQALSKDINRGFVYDAQKINPEPVDTEAPNLWRRFGSGTYVLMYDVFGAKPLGEMGFSETEDFVHFRDLGRFNQPGSRMKATNFQQAKHGAVMAITAQEGARLQAWFRKNR